MNRAQTLANTELMTSVSTGQTDVPLKRCVILLRARSALRERFSEEGQNAPIFWMGGGHGIATPRHKPVRWTRHATVEVHHFVSEAPHLRTSIPSPKD